MGPPGDQGWRTRSDANDEARARNCFSLLRILGVFFCMDLKGLILKHAMRFQRPVDFFFSSLRTRKKVYESKQNQGRPHDGERRVHTGGFGN